MPRPSSTTRQPPSASSVTSTRVQKPAIASSTELSTTSQMRWWRPARPVEPMYIPGRLRTGSRPSRTWMSWAPYPALGCLASDDTRTSIIGDNVRADLHFCGGDPWMAAGPGAAANPRRELLTSLPPGCDAKADSPRRTPARTGWSAAADADVDRVDPRPGLFGQPALHRLLQEAQLRRPCGVIDLDHQTGAVEAHRLDVRGHGRSDRGIPPPEHPAHRGHGGATGAAGGLVSQVAHDGGQAVAQPHRPAALVVVAPPQPGPPPSPPPASTRTIASGWAASGSTPAVVRITWPAGKWASSFVERRVSSSLSTSSSTSTGAVPARSVISRCAPSRRARAKVRCSPCEAWVRAGIPATASSTWSRWGPTVETPRRTSSCRASVNAAGRPVRRQAGS